MKNLKKIASLLLALALVLSLAVTAFAADGTITINPPSGIDADATNTYKIYKVFNATGSGDKLSYTLVEGKEDVPAGFKLENGYVTYAGTGNALTADDIAAIAAYVRESDLVDTATSTGNAAAVSKPLEPGYYYIATSTGTAVTIDSVGGNETVNDKNTIPSVDKKITNASSYDENGLKALAQIGTPVEFTATVTVGKGAKNYVFHDTMSAGLQYNNDVLVSGIEAGKYTVKETPDEGDTITITFENGLTEGTVITIRYTATITEAALDTDPENNTAYVTYGDSYNTEEKLTHVYNAQFTVTKKDGEGKPLADAGFVLKNASGKFYKYDADAKKVEWVDTVDEADEHKSDAEGKVAPFVGLANGTYTLVENTVPDGYNKASDVNFTIAEHDYTATNLQQVAEVINKAGTVLPSTGGMGTTLFYVAGGILVAAAVVLLVTKKRMSAE